MATKTRQQRLVKDILLFLKDVPIADAYMLADKFSSNPKTISMAIETINKTLQHPIVSTKRKKNGYNYSITPYGTALANKLQTSELTTLSSADTPVPTRATIVPTRATIVPTRATIITTKEKIVAVLKEHNYLSAREISEKTGIIPVSVYKYLNREGAFKRVGNRKSYRYALTDLDESIPQTPEDSTESRLEDGAELTDKLQIDTTLLSSPTINAIPANALEEALEQYVSNLQSSADFVTVKDIFTKAIAHVNRIPYDAVESFGKRLAYFIYITQEHESKAWELSRAPTALEERINALIAGDPARSTLTAENIKSFLEAILRNIRHNKLQNLESIIEVPDNILTKSDRQLIYQFLLDTKLVKQSTYETNLSTGQTWRYSTFRFNEEAILSYAESTGAIKVFLENKECFDLIKTIIKSGYAEDSDVVIKEHTLRLQDFGLLKISESSEYGISPSGISNEEEFKYEKKGTFTLSPKLLQHSDSIRTIILLDSNERPLHATLARFNFDVEEAKKMGLNDYDDIRNLQIVEQKQYTKFPRFFKPNYDVTKNTTLFKALIAQLYGLEDLARAAKEKLASGREISEKDAPSAPSTPKLHRASLDKSNLVPKTKAPEISRVIAEVMPLPAATSEPEVLEDRLNAEPITPITMDAVEPDIYDRVKAYLNTEQREKQPQAPTIHSNTEVFNNDTQKETTAMAKGKGQGKGGKRIRITNIAAAIHEREIPEKQWANFAAEVYQNCGLSPEDAQKQGKKCVERLSKEYKTIAAAASYGSSKRIADYLPSGETTSVEDIVSDAPKSKRRKAVASTEHSVKQYIDAGLDLLIAQGAPEEYLQQVKDATTQAVDAYNSAVKENLETALAHAKARQTYLKQ